MENEKGKEIQKGKDKKIRELSTIAYDCHHFATKFPLQTGPKGHKCAQLLTIVHELRRVAVSPHVRATI